ncbi:MAG: DNA primase, partial [Pedobacter agri]
YPIKASVFVRESSSLLQIEESILMSELNKMRSAKLKKNFEGNQRTNNVNSNQNPYSSGPPEPLGPPDNLWDDSAGPYGQEQQTANTDEIQEKEIVRLLLTYGHEFVNWDKIDDMYIGPFIMQNLADVEFEDLMCKKIIDHYSAEIDEGRLPTANHFIKHEERDIADLAITLSTSEYALSENWLNKHLIYVKDESMNLKATILGGIFHLKKRKVDKILTNLLKEIKEETDTDNQMILMQRYGVIKGVEREISKFLGSVIVK